MSDDKAPNSDRQVDRMRPAPDQTPEPMPDKPRKSPASGAQARARTARSLQRQAGNARVGQMLGASVQRRSARDTRYTVNAPGDAHEQEADRVAAQVMRQPQRPRDTDLSGQSTPDVQRCPACKQTIQRQPGDDAYADGLCPSCRMQQALAGAVQRQARPGETPAVTPDTANYLDASQGGGRALPSGTRTAGETTLGRDFGNVRVHDDAAANEAAESLNARAFTRGSDIYLARNESANDRNLMGHELTHVVQQTSPTMGTGGPGEGAVQRLESADVHAATQPTQGDKADEPVFEAYKGKDVQTRGHVSAAAKEYQIAKSQGVNIRAKPDGTLTPIGRILYDTLVHVRALDNTGGFYFVVAHTGQIGWINKNYVILNPPDPNAHLHHITEPNLTTILDNEYVDTNKWQLSTGNDFTTLAAAVVVANKGLIGVEVKWEDAQKYKAEHKFKRLSDPWMIDNFAIYHASHIKKGHNIWLPSTTYIRMLQNSGVIGSRPDLVNTAVDVSNGIAGFFAGLVEGVFGSIWDTLTGLWELAKGIVNTIKSALDGSLFAAAGELYDTIMSMTWQDFKNIVMEIITMARDALIDFKDKWIHPDTYKKWHFRGYVIGAIALEVVLAIFTGGKSLAAKVLAKIGKYFPKLKAVLSALLKKADDLSLDRFRKGKRRRHGDSDQDADQRRKKDTDDMSMADREWEQTRALASVFTEAHDAKDTPVEVLIPMLNVTFAAKSTVVRGYKPIPKGPGRYRIIQLARRNNVVDDSYDVKLPERTHRVFEPSTERSEASDWGERWQQTPRQASGSRVKRGKHKPTPVREGTWKGERGNGVFEPDDPRIAKLLEERGVHGVRYRNGYPDFGPPLAEDTVVLDVDLTHSRNINYSRIHEAFAKKWNLDGRAGGPWTSAKVRRELEHKGWTPHEVEDSRTVHLVDSEIHGFFQHMGGVAEQKRLRGQ